MVRLAVVAVIGLLLWAQGALAQENTTEGDALQQAMDRNPERMANRLVDLVAGFGQNGGLTLAGIEEHIAIERAAARATALRRFLAMDLDADGGVDRSEMAVLQRAAGSAMRGRMERQFVLADADNDGRVDPKELAAAGRAAAFRGLGEDEADLLRAAMRLDADGDGRLTAAEIMDGATKARDGA